METPNSSLDLLNDLIDVLQHLRRIVTNGDTEFASEQLDSTDSRVYPCQEKVDFQKNGFCEIIRKYEQFRSNESIQLAMRCLSILVHGPKTVENCSEDFMKLFPVFYNVAVIVLTISNLVSLMMLESAEENANSENKKDFEDLIKLAHDAIFSHEPWFQEIADAMALPSAQMMKPTISRLNYISEQCEIHLQECTKKMLDFLAKRELSTESTPQRKKSGWSIFSLGAVTVDTGVATVATGDIVEGNAKSGSIKQEITWIQERCQTFLQDVERLKKRFTEMEAAK